jgi:hypothetical protein
VATVDADGWARRLLGQGRGSGFVQVPSPTELLVPFYNGNGMWRTLGTRDNAVSLPVDAERPWRMRVHGTGTVRTDPASIAGLTGAEAVLHVEVACAFPNCGRWHPHGRIDSADVPCAGRSAPIPDWKRIPVIREVA